MARITAERPSPQCSTVFAIVAPLRRNFTASRRRSFSTDLCNRYASVPFISKIRLSPGNSLTHVGRISNMLFKNFYLYWADSSTKCNGESERGEDEMG